MPAFTGLTREEEEDSVDHMKLQLLSLLEHNNEHRFFSEQMQVTIKPNFKAKRKTANDDPAWRPGAAKKPKQARSLRPPAPASTAPS